MRANVTLFQHGERPVRSVREHKEEEHGNWRHGHAEERSGQKQGEL